jgi:hypothetical protein
MRTSVGVLAGMGIMCGLTAALGAQTAAKPTDPATQKVPIVAVTGCLKQQGADWVLASASEPATSTAGATPAKEGEAPKLGKRQFKLIGVTEYNLAAMKDHTVVIKALHDVATDCTDVRFSRSIGVALTCSALMTTV